MTIDHMPIRPKKMIRRVTAVNRYYKLEKQLLDKSQAERLTNVRESFNPGKSVFHNTAAGWMLAEAALINTDLEREGRLMLLDRARQDWETALDIESSKETNKELHSICLLSNNEIKIASTLAAADMFEDIIKGDLDRKTREEYYEKLLYLGVKAAEGYEYYDEEHYPVSRFPGRDICYIGTAHEMNALLTIARLQSPSLVCAPSIQRADSGAHFPKQTHDLQVLNTKWGDIRNTLGIEVKTTPRKEHFKRYDAVLIGGTLHLHPNHLRDPSYLTELLVKDYKGLTSDEEKTNLSAITNNVVHSIRHGFRGTQQCREIETCQEITP